MLTLRLHEDRATASEAAYSPCLRYRYRLTRTWCRSGSRVLFVLLNPSTATERRNDPTVERCERRARKAGFGAYRICNLFAWRSSAPKMLRAVPDPVGPSNDAVIAESAGWADEVVCGWGNHGLFQDRAVEIEQLLRQRGAALHHFGLTLAGQPRHPLYVPYARQPQPWAPADCNAAAAIPQHRPARQAS